MIKKTTIQMVMAWAIALGFAAVAFALPEDGKRKGPSAAAAPSPTPRAVIAQRAQGLPVPYHPSDRLRNINMFKAQAPAFRGGVGGPQRVLSAGVPYVTVRVGTTEVHSNNHAGRNMRVSNNGVAHIIYETLDADPDDTIRAPADSNTNGIYFYNAYDCGNSNGLRNGSKDVEMLKVFTGIGDTRPRKLYGRGGIILPGTGKAVPYAFGQRAILRTDLPGAGRYEDSPFGWAVMKDAAQCQAIFGMDTMYTDRDVGDHIMHAVNESTWVVTSADIANSNAIKFSYTTDRGLSWAAKTTLATYSAWWNGCEIASVDSFIYVVSMTDPNQTTAFNTTERPCYLKGVYHDANGSITWGTIQDIPADAGFSQYGFLASFAGDAAIMVGNVLHVAWLDWNQGDGFPGPGGHVMHATVQLDGSAEVHKVADINIDGNLPDITATLYGFGNAAWAQVALTYDAGNNRLFCLWSQPPDNGDFGWADYEVTGNLACFDIFCSVSPNLGVGWDAPSNVTQTNNPGCDGSIGDPCGHEYWFTAEDHTVNDTIWILSDYKLYPGFQETAERGGIQPDVGPWTERRDEVRLYKAPSRAAVLSARGALGSVPGDTVNPYALNLKAGGASFAMTLRLSNIGLLGFVTDSIKIGSGLNDGFLATSSDWTAGNSVNVGDFYDFQVTFDPSGVTPASIGARLGDVQVYVHSVSPASNQEIGQGFQCYILPTLCLNRSLQIHSGANRSDVWSQGALVNEGGEGMHEGPASPGGIDRFYDGGVWIANSSLNAAAGVPGVPRKVTRQLFNDEFLRCLADIELSSQVVAPGDTSYAASSIATDVEDSTIVWKNIWEQSTHPDSSGFLLQTVKVINIGSSSIDSVAMGVAYDIDVYSTISNPGRNVSGDTFVTYSGRKFWLGWTAGPDVTIDSCSPNNEFYGVIGIPGSIGLSGDSIHPRGASVYDQRGFSYNVDNGIASGGDSSAQRMMYNLNVCTSTRRRTHDSLTGVWQDTAQAPPFSRRPGTYQICGGVADPLNYQNYGAPRWRDEGYVSVAKKVYNFPVNNTGANLVSRWGLDGLAAGVDSAFKGPGETFTYIHLASAGGLSQLMTNGVKGIDWYVKHGNLQAGPYQSVQLRNDHDNNGQPNPADVVGELNKVFLNVGSVSDCVADLDLNGNVAPADVVLSLQKVFLNQGCPWCYSRCP